jgi:acyl-coenzyme A thioesterase PaaI-like protein
MNLSKATESLTQFVAGPLSQVIPAKMRDTFYLRAFGLFKVPVLLFVSPSVVELNESRCVVRIPLNRRTKNHLNSMYFAVLAAGADVAGGLMAMRLIQEQGDQVSLVFKDFQAQFLKRAEGDTHFTCEDGVGIRELVQKAIDSGERENMTVHVKATVPSQLGDEPVAEFKLTLSLKKKNKKSSA